MEPMELAACRWVVGSEVVDALPEPPVRDVPSLATDALVAGLDTPSLRELAGADPSDHGEVQLLLEKTLDELGLDLPDEQTAYGQLVRYLAQQIVDRDIVPMAGAVAIERLSHRVEREGDLRIFVGLTSQAEDHPEDLAVIDERIEHAAQELLTRPELRRWLRVQASRGAPPITDSGTRVAVRPEDVGASLHLSDAFARWAAAYEATFVESRRTSAGFDSREEAEAFVSRGRELAERLGEELGECWHVEYHQEATRPPGLRLRSRR